MKSRLDHEGKYSFKFNNNIRCIEIYWNATRYNDDGQFNNNIRCIEIAAAIAANASMAKFNNNIRCIEIMKPINDELKAIPV